MKRFLLSHSKAPVTKMILMTAAAVLVPLALTIYSWQLIATNVHQKQLQEFQMLALENERALEHRIDSYEYALLGGAGFFEGSNYVSRDEWHTYVENMDIEKNFPGMKGMGIALPIKNEMLPAFVKKMRRTNDANFTIHPPTVNRPNNIIIYIDPLQDNKQAVGLNIGFEDNRLEASSWARDSGKPAITKKITLLQSVQHEPGFLLLHPLYNKDLPINTLSERRQAFLGWIYAPFVAKSFLKNLTKSQDYSLNIRIYDKGIQTPENLIYNSDNTEQVNVVPKFTVSKQMTVMQQNWLVIWESTGTFEQNQKNGNPLLVLWAGLLFTGIWGVFLIMSSRNDTKLLAEEERKFFLPSLVFIVTVICSFYLYDTLKQQELGFVKAAIEQESKKIDQLVFFQTSEKIQALRRMSQRWESAQRTPVRQWHDDARNYTQQLTGLKTIEWIDTTNHVKWVEPFKGNEKVVGMDILFDEKRKQALEGAAERNIPTITPPLNLVQGYRGFIAYVPLIVNNKKDGFIAGIFSIDEFINNILKDELRDRYAITIQDNEDMFYENKNSADALKKAWTISRKINIYDKTWTIKITPTESFVKNHLTFLPAIVLTCGLLIAMLLSLTVRYVLVARVKSHRLLIREETLKRYNNLNTAILDSANALIIATDTTGKVILFNHAAENALGYTAEEIVAHHTPALWHQKEEIAKRAVELSQELQRPVQPGFEVFTALADRDGFESRVWSLVRKDGSVFLGNLTATPLYDGHDTVIGYLGLIENITEQMRQQQELKISEETFRSAMQHASIGMALVDLQGAWLKVNQSLCDLLGYSESELMASNFQSITHPDDLNQDLQFVDDLLTRKRNAYQMEKRYFHKGGHTIWVLLSVSLVWGSDGFPKYFVSQIQDITQKKEMDRIKSEFISVVSHELRTPLTSIRGSLGLIANKMSADLPEKVSRLIQIAHENSERLILLINDILDIDKIASGQMRFDIKEEPLMPILQKAADANQAYAEKFNVSINLINNPDPVVVKVDATRLIQVLSNFLSNAAKFSPEHEIIDMSASVMGDHVRVTVKDHGPGIPESFRPQIFGRFSQEDSSSTRNKGGTGLGLHISKEIIEHMGGKIGFDSEVNQGSSFWVELPLLHSVVDSTVTSNTPAAAPLPVTISRDLPKILHIEDDESLINFFTNALQDKANVTAATTLAQGMETLQHQHFDMIILDMSMPDGSGAVVLDFIQKTPHHETPVMILSALEAPDNIKNLVTAHMVKSRMSETKIIEEILNLLYPDNRNKA